MLFLYQICSLTKMKMACVNWFPVEPILIEQNTTLSVKKSIPMQLDSCTLLKIYFWYTPYTILNNTSVWWRYVYAYLIKKINKTKIILTVIIQ